MLIIIASLITAIAVIAAAFIHRLDDKLNQIHILVNSRLTEALRKIDELEILLEEKEVTHEKNS